MQEQDPFVVEQETVWGKGPEWSEAIGRLQYFDNEVQSLVAKATAEGNPVAILDVATNYIAPASERTNPVFIRVLERVARIREPLLASLEHSIKVGAPPHVLAQCACNAVLRGKV